MALRKKLFTTTTLAFALGAFGVFASAETTETPTTDGTKAEKHDRKGRFGKRGEAGKRGGMHRGGAGKHGMAAEWECFVASN